MLPYNGKRPGPNFTWGCEGSADPFADQFNMFEPHVPSGSSGVTVCGFDLFQNQGTLKQDARKAGFSDNEICTLSLMARYTGNHAKNERNRLRALVDFRLERCVKLFEIAYNRMEDDLLRIHREDWFLEEYGVMPRIPQWVWDLLVDLRFRGDYHKETRPHFVPLLIGRKWDMFGAAMHNFGDFPGVPQDRLERRAEYALVGVEDMQVQPPQSLFINQAKQHLTAALRELDKIGA